MLDVKGYVSYFAMQQENKQMDTGKVVIKKYANRRLYDTSHSRYINLEDIAALVRNGKEVQVVDAGTGDDITRVTLTQIIVEDAKGQPAGLPLELLRQLIVTTDHVGQEFIMWYLKSAFDSYQKVQSSLQDRFSQMQSAALSPLADGQERSCKASARRRAANPIRRWMRCASASRNSRRSCKESKVSGKEESARRP